MLKKSLPGKYKNKGEQHESYIKKLLEDLT